MLSGMKNKLIENFPLVQLPELGKVGPATQRVFTLIDSRPHIDLHKVTNDAVACLVPCQTKLSLYS